MRIFAFVIATCIVHKHVRRRRRYLETTTTEVQQPRTGRRSGRGTMVMANAHGLRPRRGHGPAMVPLRRAQLAARRQQWTKCLNFVEELNQRHPDFELAYEADYLRGRALAGRGQMSAARESYQRVLNNPNAQQTETAAMAQWMIGETYFHQYDLPRAREVYLKVIEQHPKPEWQARARPTSR